MSGRTASGAYTTLSSRRIWSFAEKAAILAEMAVPGAIVMEVARRHGIAQSLLYRWRQDAATAALSNPAPVFVPVVLNASPTVQPTPRPVRKRREPPVGTALASIIEIDLIGGRTVRVTADIDLSALARIVTALEGPAEGRS